MNMKAIYKILFMGVLLVVMASCVDEYTDAQRPKTLDGPQIYVVAPDGSTVTSRRATGTGFESPAVTYILKGQPTTFTVNVIDAPGLIDRVTVSLSDTLKSHTIEAQNFTTVKGKTSGSFEVVYTPHPDDPAATYDDGIITLSITVIDAQNKSTGPQTVRVRAIPCIPSINLAGWWKATASGETSEPFLDGTHNEDMTYTNLNTNNKFQIRFSGGTAAQNAYAQANEHGAQIMIPDITFGLWPKQGFAPVTARLRFCGSTLTEVRSASLSANTLFSASWAISGQVNEDGTITIEWEHVVFGDSGTVTLTYDGY
jgi:hypothetical protein